MAKTDFHKELLASDTFAVYSLRSSFFLRRLRAIDLWKAIDEVQNLRLVKEGFPWSNRGTWGIEEEAWSRATEWGLEPLSVFAHPRVLAEQPRLLLYYRTMALLSQKGLRSLVKGAAIERAEAGKLERLDPTAAERIAIAVNSVLSAIISAGAEIRAEHLAGLQFAAAGATIQGSWNNAIGRRRRSGRPVNAVEPSAGRDRAGGLERRRDHRIHG